MPTTTSVIAAALSLYDSLSAANFPSGTAVPIYFDEAAQAGASGQIRPPFVILRDKTGRMPDVQSDFGGTESGDIVLEVYANTLADVDTIVQTIKWNGQAPKLHAGFDCGTLTLSSPYHFMHLLRTGERRTFTGFDHAVARVHSCQLVYAVMTDFNAAG